MELQKLNSLDLTPPKLSNSEMLSFLASLNLPTKKLVKARNKKSNRKVPQAPIIDDDELPTEADMAYLRGEYWLQIGKFKPNIGANKAPFVVMGVR